MNTVVKRAAKNAASTDSEYSGTIAMSPAISRVDTRYDTECTAMHSTASISSDTRMAPSWAVAPAPMVAAKRDTGDHRRDDADVEEGRQEPGQRLDADVAQRRVTLHRDDPAGRQVRKAATPTVPPIMTSAPAPSVISATSRIVSLRYRVRALGT